MRTALTATARRLHDVIPVAHNAAFDTGFLNVAARRQRIDLDIGPVICTLAMSRALDPERRMSHRLGDICDRLGISLDRPHDALHDAEATVAVLPHLLSGLEVTSPDQLGRFVGSGDVQPGGGPSTAPARR